MDKDVELMFEVLVSRWNIFLSTCMFCDKRVIYLKVRTSIILHNMIVEE